MYTGAVPGSPQPKTSASNMRAIADLAMPGFLAAMDLVSPILLMVGIPSDNWARRPHVVQRKSAAEAGSR
jgi:hypothetical protein